MRQHQATKRLERIFFLIRSGVHTSRNGISSYRERINDCHMSTCTRGKQVSCIWRCRYDKHHVNGTPKHSQHGRKTLWVCVTCHVPLCKVKRYDGKSCFALFHGAEQLFNPCCAASQEGLLVRTPANGKQCSSPIKGLAVTRAASVAENATEEGGAVMMVYPMSTTMEAMMSMSSNGGPRPIMVRGMTLRRILPAKMKSRMFSSVHELGNVKILELQ
jgi:hypothetical protein